MTAMTLGQRAALLLEIAKQWRDLLRSRPRTQGGIKWKSESQAEKERARKRRYYRERGA